MNTKNRPVKEYPIVGACGLECGLCSRYYTAGPSRCPGCCGEGFFDKHPACSIITCCVKKKGLEVCAECQEFPCFRFKKEEDHIKDEAKNFSYPPYRKIIPDLNLIKKYGLEKFIKQLEKRIELLKIMIKNFNDGRSRGLFCWTAALAETKDIEVLLDKTQKEIKQVQVNSQDIKSRARIMKKNIYELFEKRKIQIKKY